MLKNVALALALVLLASTPVSALCFQDQEGNQYDITINREHEIVTGIATSQPQCDTTFWEVFGSFSKNAGIYSYEMTVVNPLGMSDSMCFRFYKIKGQWPDGDWYYSPPDDIHAAGNSFTWKKCTAPRSAFEPQGVSGKGQLK